jgi:hypothetical protein
MPVRGRSGRLAAPSFLAGRLRQLLPVLHPVGVFLENVSHELLPNLVILAGGIGKMVTKTGIFLAWADTLTLDVSVSWAQSFVSD